MTIEPGQQLLHYRLVAQIGEGGMGVVWRATDTSLGRDVAIKLLPELPSVDDERLQRFEREARLLASLNHTHIATIHGLHEIPDGDASTGSVRFLVMELVEGEDLHDRIVRGAIPLERSIEIATQVALALEVAHGQGVIHRDLKPANVRLTTDGEVKVLDFGLAKALSPEAASGTGGGPSLSPTLTSAGTMAGVILGTAAYMSPEQARGKPVDARADLWAFGCVLFEMLSGGRCFQGDTISDTLASVLKTEPDWTRLPDETPPAIRRLLRRCLAKDSRQRLADATAARLELSEALEPPFPGELPELTSEPAPPAEPARGRLLPWVVAGLAFLAAVLVWFNGSGTEVLPSREPLELSIAIPSGMTLVDDQESLLALSPDGRYLAFSAISEGAQNPALFLRRLDDASIVELPDSTHGINPFFSSDSQWIGFFAAGLMKKIRVDGTAAVPICEFTGSPRGASWGEDDQIVFPLHFAGALMRVAGSGGEPEVLTELDAENQERTHRWPQALPEHDVVLFTVATEDSPEFYDDARIEALRLSTGERKTIFQDASLAHYVPSGHLIVARAGFLFAVPFDIERLEATGSAVPVVEGVMGASNSGIVFASIARNGLLAFVSGEARGSLRELKWVYPDGNDQALAGLESGVYVDPALSPDGKRIAVSLAGDRAFDIWIVDIARSGSARLTFEGDCLDPAWTPDGKSVIYTSRRNGMDSVYIKPADGSGEERAIFVKPQGAAVSDVSQDGRLVALAVQGLGNNRADIYVKSLVDLDSEEVPFLVGLADEGDARFSPDGRWLAYVSDETGNYEIFVRPYPGPGGRWQISNHNGIDPRWSPDGRKLHYLNNREWWVVDVMPGENGQTFRAGVPQLLRDDFPRAVLERTYDLTVDGEGLLFAMPKDADAAPSEVRVIVDWFSELERLAGP